MGRVTALKILTWVTAVTLGSAAGCGGSGGLLTPLPGEGDDTPDVSDVSDASAAPEGEVDAGPPPEPVATSLIDNELWLAVGTSSDPFVEPGDPAPDVCPESDYQSEVSPEGVVFDIRTEGCAWLTVTQPLGVDVPAGAQLRITAFHGEIEAGDEDYTLLVAIGDPPTIVWQVEVPLGEEEHSFPEVVDEVPEAGHGEPIWVHLSNHGQNSWTLVDIEVLVTP